MVAPREDSRQPQKRRIISEKKNEGVQREKQAPYILILCKGKPHTVRLHEISCM